MKAYIDQNQERWDRVSSRQGNPYTIPYSHEELQELKDKPIEVALTVGKLVPLTWFEKAKGKRLLGLACGGGQQGPMFAMHGYETTIMDFSEEQLTKDRLVAERENIQIDTVHADMTKLFPFEDESFDIIFCPVSNAYISDLENMWKESYRVLKKGGLLMVGYMNPWIYMYDGDDVWDFPDKELLLKYSLPYDSSELEKQGNIEINPEYGYEFSHTLESQIGGQLKVGFAMIDFYESKDSRNRLSQFGSDYIANLSVKL
ncbi:class I SAM-dependent methyltransferase (plasmid) [Enterococcus faecalis]|uniref:class I SAM-dependent methyltransferase n=1 Tax=Enterococcus faecalis TaxID=1351 RepID=UPI00200EC5D7|nr:class I SAM-dependent methyltransferase [Enterococcus faecalis]UQF47402.1 class I SAM-dependent methyltransferase [Enterococcus faecalis]HBB5493764.1 class I SAM-dependent methyltransferase [Listeria monocytogenes]